MAGIQRKPISAKPSSGCDRPGGGFALRPHIRSASVLNGGLSIDLFFHADYNMHVEKGIARSFFTLNQRAMKRGE